MAAGLCIGSAHSNCLDVDKKCGGITGFRVVMCMRFTLRRNFSIRMQSPSRGLFLSNCKHRSAIKQCCWQYYWNISNLVKRRTEILFCESFLGRDEALYGPGKTNINSVSVFSSTQIYFIFLFIEIYYF
jgi:hypothetical protein